MVRTGNPASSGIYTRRRKCSEAQVKYWKIVLNLGAKARHKQLLHSHINITNQQKYKILFQKK
jgi:hypothetical protein